MILDSIENIGRYADIRDLSEAVDYILHHNVAAMPAGHYEIDGEHLFLNIFEFQGKCRDDARYEVHGKYLDLQYVLSGCEQMGYLPSAAAGMQKINNNSGDIWFYSYRPEETELTVNAGMFAVFYPGELHAPGIGLSDGPMIKKAVFKIRADNISGIRKG